MAPVKPVHCRVCESSNRDIVHVIYLKKGNQASDKTPSGTQNGMDLSFMESAPQKGLNLYSTREYNVPLLLPRFHPGSIFHPRLNHSLSISPLLVWLSLVSLSCHSTGQNKKNDPHQQKNTQVEMLSPLQPLGS